MNNGKEEPDKFADFDRMIAESKQKGFEHVLIAYPQVLGDTYEELIENMNKLADAGLSLSIAKARR